MMRNFISPQRISAVVVAMVSITLTIGSVVVPTPSLLQMRTIDVFDTTLANGFRWIVASVEANKYDSAMIARYSTMLYHRYVPHHQDDTGAVQMEMYVYNPDKCMDLSPSDIAILTRNNPALIDRLSRLTVVDSAFVAVRFSTPWMLFGRDTLTIVQTRVYIPAEGYQWSSIIRRTKL